MPDPVITAVVIGGVAYAVTREPEVVGPPGAPGYIQPNYGSTIGQITSGWDSGNGYSYDPLLDNGGQAGFAPRPLDPTVQQKLDLLHDAAKKQFENMNDVQRSNAANAMNKALELNPPLNSTDTWETIVSAASGAAGAAACTVLPGGAALAPLCAIGASYLGVKLEAWIENGVGDLASWVDDNIWKGVSGGVSDAYNWVEDKIKDVGGWIADIF